MNLRDYERLQKWIKTGYKFDKDLERKANDVKEIELELSAEEM